ncbi:MAG: Holliday junction resolvase RuvX [Patescibacteria group bacterium]
MKKLLGIDYGDSRIGIAIGDLGSIAVPYSVLKAGDAFWDELGQIIRDEHIAELVVGWPLSLSGRENERTEATKHFLKLARERTGLPVHIEDERLTTVQAGRNSVGKARIDAAAAATILQSYIDSHADRSRHTL